MMRSSDNAGEEDGEEEDGEISTDLKSKTLVFWTIASVNYQSSKKKKKLCTDMDHCFSELPKELSRSSGETKTPPIYSGETHQRHHLLRRNPVQNPSDHKVQSGRRSSVRPTSINRDISSGGYKDNEDGAIKVGKTRMQGSVVIRNWWRETLHWSGACIMGLAVRVIRGRKYEGSPSGKVYIYDGTSDSDKSSGNKWSVEAEQMQVFDTK